MSLDQTLPFLDDKLHHVTDLIPPGSLYITFCLCQDISFLELGRPRCLLVPVSSILSSVLAPLKHLPPVGVAQRWYLVQGLWARVVYCVVRRTSLVNVALHVRTYGSSAPPFGGIASIVMKCPAGLKRRVDFWESISLFGSTLLVTFVGSQVDADVKSLDVIYCHNLGSSQVRLPGLPKAAGGMTPSVVPASRISSSKSFPKYVSPRTTLSPCDRKQANQSGTFHFTAFQQQRNLDAPRAGEPCRLPIPCHVRQKDQGRTGVHDTRSAPWTGSVPVLFPLKGMIGICISVRKVGTLCTRCRLFPFSHILTAFSIPDGRAATLLGSEANPETLLPRKHRTDKETIADMQCYAKGTDHPAFLFQQPRYPQYIGRVQAKDPERSVRPHTAGSVEAIRENSAGDGRIERTKGHARSGADRVTTFIRDRQTTIDRPGYHSVEQEPSTQFHSEDKPRRAHHDYGINPEGDFNRVNTFTRNLHREEERASVRNNREYGPITRSYTPHPNSTLLSERSEFGTTGGSQQYTTGRSGHKETGAPVISHLSRLGIDDIVLAAADRRGRCGPMDSFHAVKPGHSFNTEGIKARAAAHFQRGWLSSSIRQQAQEGGPFFHYVHGARCTRSLTPPGRIRSAFFATNGAGQVMEPVAVSWCPVRSYFRALASDSPPEAEAEPVHLDSSREDVAQHLARRLVCGSYSLKALYPHDRKMVVDWLKSEWKPLLNLPVGEESIVEWNRSAVAKWRLFESTFRVALAWTGFDAGGPDTEVRSGASHLFSLEALVAHYRQSAAFHSRSSGCSSCRGKNSEACSSDLAAYLKLSFASTPSASGGEVPDFGSLSREQMAAWSLATSFLSLALLGRALDSSCIDSCGHALLLRWQPTVEWIFAGWEDQGLAPDVEPDDAPPPYPGSAADFNTPPKLTHGLALFLYSHRLGSIHTITKHRVYKYPQIVYKRLAISSPPEGPFMTMEITPEGGAVRPKVELLQFGRHVYKGVDMRQGGASIRQGARRTKNNVNTNSTSPTQMGHDEGRVDPLTGGKRYRSGTRGLYVTGGEDDRGETSSTKNQSDGWIDGTPQGVGGRVGAPDAGHWIVLLSTYTLNPAVDIRLSKHTEEIVLITRQTWARTEKITRRGPENRITASMGRAWPVTDVVWVDTTGSPSKYAEPDCVACACYFCGREGEFFSLSLLCPIVEDMTIPGPSDPAVLLSFTSLGAMMASWLSLSDTVEGLDHADAEWNASALDTSDQGDCCLLLLFQSSGRFRGLWREPELATQLQSLLGGLSEFDADGMLGTADADVLCELIPHTHTTAWLETRRDVLEFCTYQFAQAPLFPKVDVTMDSFHVRQWTNYVDRLDTQDVYKRKSATTGETKENKRTRRMHNTTRCVYKGLDWLWRVTLTTPRSTHDVYKEVGTAQEERVNSPTDKVHRRFDHSVDSLLKYLPTHDNNQSHTGPATGRSMSERSESLHAWRESKVPQLEARIVRGTDSRNGMSARAEVMY
ncbi:hypothetical protein HRG_014230 [Hirsutella rhossiliensis]